MSNLLPFIVIGLVTGSAYSLAAVGLVLTYETSGVMNFGQGAIAAAAAYVFYQLYVDDHWPWGAAMVVSVLVLGCLLGVLLEYLGRRLAGRPSSLHIVGTVGIILLIQGGTYQWKGQAYRAFPSYLPSGRVKVSSVYISYGQMIVFGVGVAATAFVYGLLRRTRVGYATRAVVDDPDLLSLSGTSPSVVRRMAWIIGSVMACLAGVLLAPSLSLDSILLTMLVVQAFGAAVLGYFRSLPVAYLGGLVVGVIAAITTKYVTGSTSWLAGIPSAVPFIILFLALIFLKKEKFVVRQAVRTSAASEWRAPGRVRVGFGAAVLLALALVPLWAGSRMPVYLVGASYVLLFMSLGLLVKSAGQVSLCHLAFGAIGLTTFAHLTNSVRIPWPLAVVLAGAAAVPAGALIAIPAIRVSDVYLALATLGFGVVVQEVFYSTNLMFGSSAQAAQIRRPSAMATDERYYYLVLAICVVVGLGLMTLQASRLGRLLRGLSQSPKALTSLGVSTNVTLITVFCLSAFLAGVFGAVYGGAVETANGTSFESFSSLILLVVLAIMPGSLPWYALLAAVGYEIAPSYLGSLLSPYEFTILFGAFAIQTAMFGAPTVPMRVRALLDRLGGAEAGTRHLPLSARSRSGGEPKRVRVDTKPAASRRRVNRGLEVEGLNVRYRGVSAVTDLTFSAPMGSITGLIGPNGAGKTTTFDACSGFVTPVSGQVKLNGYDLSNMPPAARARSGLGRTFQRMQLLELQTVADNVAMGYEAPQVGRGVVAQLGGRRGDRRNALMASGEALELCGIDQLSNALVSDLSTGERRLVELARCLAGPFDLLLLDEPSSGLDRDTTQHFGEILGSVVSERGTGVVLVEHDMSLVMRVCSYVYVLDFGQLMFEGTPDEVLSSEVVQAAYLGTDVFTNDVKSAAPLSRQ